MIVKVVGYERIQGTSKKTGKPFDFYKTYVVYDRSGMHGVCTDSLILRADRYDEPVIDGSYNVDRDFSGYLIDFSEV